MRIVRNVVLVALGLYGLIVIFLFLAQEAFLFQPVPLVREYKFDFEQQFEEIELENSDGASLHAIHFKHDNNKGLILYYHGNAGNLRRWGEVVQFHVSLGYDVLVMDYRKYGKSRGNWSYRGFLEDAQLFYDYARKHYDEDDITVYGRSLGTGFASWVASRNKPKRLILESPYTSIADMGAHFYPLVPARWLIRYNFRPKQYLKDVSCPVYIIHGTNDIIVPYAIGKRLFETYESDLNIHMMSIEGGGHNDLVSFKSFTDAITELLD